MSANHEEDSRMLSSPEVSDIETPTNQTIDISNISPPASQPRESRNLSMSASGASIANSNGKRPLNTISNGADDGDEIAAMANGKARQDFPVRSHPPSGYTWTKMEDEPGYAWSNQKAVDEYQRAWDSMVHKDHMVKDRYGDIFEIVEREKAIAASLRQQ